MIFLNGKLTISNCDATHEALKQAIAQGTLDIDASAVETADLTAVQIILATARAATASGSALRVVAPEGSALAGAFAAAGLDLKSLTDSPKTLTKAA